MIAGTQKEYQSDAGFTKDTPYLALTGELWGVFVNIFEKLHDDIDEKHTIVNFNDVSEIGTYTSIPLSKDNFQYIRNK